MILADSSHRRHHPANSHTPTNEINSYTLPTHCITHNLSRPTTSVCVCVCVFVPNGPDSASDWNALLHTWWYFRCSEGDNPSSLKGGNEKHVEWCWRIFGNLADDPQMPRPRSPNERFAVTSQLAMSRCFGLRKMSSSSPISPSRSAIRKTC